MVESSTFLVEAEALLNIRFKWPYGTVCANIEILSWALFPTSFGPHFWLTNKQILKVIHRVKKLPKTPKTCSIC